MLAPQCEWVDAHFDRELVDRGLEREGALDVARCAERRERAGVGDDLVGLRGQVRDVVDRVRRAGRVRDPLALSCVRPGGVLDRRDAAVFAREAELLERRRAIPRREILLVSGQDAADRASEAHGEERRDDRVLANAALRAEPTAHVVADHADL